MQGKFKFIIFLLHLTFYVFSQDSYKTITFFIEKTNISPEESLLIENIFDIAKSYILEKDKMLKYVVVLDKLENNSFKQVSNYVFTNQIDCFVLVKPQFQKNQEININIKLISGIQDVIYENTFIEKIEILQRMDNSSNFIKVLDDMSIKIQTIKKQQQKTILNKQKFKFIHDFPITNISLFVISLKLYFDARTSLKLFSFFPIEFRLTFYPLKYFEVGGFIKFDYNNMIYKYKDINGNFHFFDSVFNLTYGIFVGFSYFNENFHYSIGLQAYNLYYDLSKTQFKKPDSIDGYLLPQFSFYNKIDIKIFKFVNYSIFINLKTTPLFESVDNYFFSKPFSFDFVVLEFSFVGFSFTF